MSQQNLGDQPDTISLDEAISYATNWAQFIYPQSGSQFLRAFYIPIEDITSLAEYHNAIAVRGYLGLTDPNDPTTIKMMFVPIIEGDVDVTETAAGSAIYDFTQPCPQACDFNSPLYVPEP